MIDFRQDDIRNIKAFLENAKNESNMENRKSLYDFEPENSDSCESGDEQSQKNGKMSPKKKKKGKMAQQ